MFDIKNISTSRHWKVKRLLTGFNTQSVDAKNSRIQDMSDQTWNKAQPYPRYVWMWGYAIEYFNLNAKLHRVPKTVFVRIYKLYLRIVRVSDVD